MRSHRRQRERQNSLWPPCQRRCRFVDALTIERLVLYLKEPKSSGGQSEASWNTEAVEANVSRLRNISTPVSTVTPSGHFQVLLWNSVEKETVKWIDEL